MQLYQRPGSPYWWFDVTIECRRFRRSTKEKDRRKAALIAGEALRAAREQPATDARWRMRDLLGTYWNEVAQHKQSGSQIFFHFELLSEFIGADTPVGDLTNARLMDYRAARRGGTIVLPQASIDDRPKAWRIRMIRDGNRVRPVDAQTINRDLAHLQAAMNWARVMHGQQVPSLAWSKLKVAEKEHRIRFASADEFSALLAVAHQDLRPILIAAVTTGLRRTNILSMQWHQVDLAGSTIIVPKTKGRKPTAVRIVAPLRAALARTPAKKRKGRVFDTTNFKRRWMAAVKAAELEDFRFHDLRHTFASWARQNGADIADICDALDHSSVSVTMRYAHIKPGSHITAFDRVADLLTAQNAAQSAVND